MPPAELAIAGVLAGHAVRALLPLVSGGYRFDGRKKFCTQAPVAGVVSTSAVLGEPGPDAVVLHAGVPLSADGVSIVETWDTLGMRGTASHDVVINSAHVGIWYVFSSW